MRTRWRKPARRLIPCEPKDRHESIAAERRGLETEVERLRCRDRVDLEVWDDGRLRISCSTGMRIARSGDPLPVLEKLPDRAPWTVVWSALFDYPEAPE